MQSISLPIALAVLFVAGVLLFGVGTSLLRSEKRRSEPPHWPTLVDESLAVTDADTRRDIVERLALLGTPWSRGILETALRDERDSAVRRLIETSLR